MSFAALDIMESFAEETSHVRRHAWIDTKSFRFFKRTPRRKPADKTPGPLRQARAMVAALRQQGATPAAVRVWIDTQSTYTVRDVFAAGLPCDAFAIACRR